MVDLPNPLTPPDCDLRDFPFMSLDVLRLRDSDFASVTTGEEFRAGLLLWCASWHQVPAGSVSNDDAVLAKLAGYGRVVEAWKEVSKGALHGWIECSDGRLYHPTIAEKALEAWKSKQTYAYKKYTDRARKENDRRKKSNQEELLILSIEEWLMEQSKVSNGKNNISNGKGDDFQRKQPNIPTEEKGTINDGSENQIIDNEQNSQKSAENGKSNISNGKIELSSGNDNSSSGKQEISVGNPSENALIGIGIGIREDKIREDIKDKNMKEAQVPPLSPENPIPKITPLDMLLENNISKQLAEDWLTVRKDKKAKTLTQTALKGLLREAGKANLTPDQAIQLCIERNWISLNAGWLEQKQFTQNQSTRPNSKDVPTEYTQTETVSKL